MLLAIAIISLYVLAVAASVITIAQSPSFESVTVIESGLRTRLIQAKEVEAIIPVDLAMAHYFASPIEAKRVQYDVLKSYSV